MEQPVNSIITTRAIATTIDRARPHDSRSSLIREAETGFLKADCEIRNQLERTSWDKLSAPVARRIREQFEDDDIVYAVFDLGSLRRPSLPVCTYGDYDDLTAIEHAKDLGDAIVVGVHKDGFVDGIHARRSVTSARLIEAASCTQPDTWRLVAAIIEMWALRNQRMTLSPNAVAHIRAGVSSEDPIMALYDWHDLTRHVTTFRGPSKIQALMHAFEHDCLGIAVWPDGEIAGLETGPGPDISFEEVLAHLNSTFDGNPPSDALAVLAAVSNVWHWDAAFEATKHCYGDDITMYDVPESPLLVEVKRRYVAARARETAS